VIVDAHPKEFIGVKLHQTVFLTGLDKYIGIVCPLLTITPLSLKYIYRVFKKAVFISLIRVSAT